MKDVKLYCTRCGDVNYPKKVTGGSFLIEVILWLCFLVPGIIYSIWRLTGGRTNVCRKCGGAELIPVDSPRAKAALGK